MASALHTAKLCKWLIRALVSNQVLSFSAAIDGQSQGASQDTGSLTERAFAAAWARVHGHNNSNAAVPSRLATSWQTQLDPTIDYPHLHSQPAATSPHGSPAMPQPHAQPQPQPQSADQPEVSQPSYLSASQTAAQQHTAAAEVAVAGQDQMHGAHEQPEAAHTSTGSPLAARSAQQASTSGTASPPKAVQQQAQPALHSSAVTGQTGSKAGVAVEPSPPRVAKAAAQAGKGPARGVSLAGIAAAAATAQQTKAQGAVGPTDLQTRATHLAMQVCVLLCKLTAITSLLPVSPVHMVTMHVCTVKGRPTNARLILVRSNL